MESWNFRVPQSTAVFIDNLGRGGGKGLGSPCSSLHVGLVKAFGLLGSGNLNLILFRPDLSL